jgi:hypothetical protein
MMTSNWLASLARNILTLGLALVAIALLYVPLFFIARWLHIPSPALVGLLAAITLLVVVVLPLALILPRRLHRS